MMHAYTTAGLVAVCLVLGLTTSSPAADRVFDRDGIRPRTLNGNSAGQGVLAATFQADSVESPVANPPTFMAEGGDAGSGAWAPSDPLSPGARQALSHPGDYEPLALENESHPPVRYAPWGNGHIVIADPATDPYLPIFESDDSESLFSRSRANLFGQPVDDEWDFYNLINTDRPDFTDATYSAGKGVTIIETGYTFRYISDHEGNTRQTRRSLPEALFRFGITDEFELRLKWNGYVLSDFHDLSTGARTQIFGGDDLYVAFKYEVWQQETWRPMFTLLSGTTVPSGTNGVSSNQLQPFVNLVWGWGIRRWLYLKVSTGVDWQKTSVSTLLGGGSEPIATTVLILRDNINVYHASASLLFQATKRVGGFAEFFSLAQSGGDDNRPANYFDTGLYLYATTNVQFDVRFGKRLSDRVEEIFTGAGLSIRY